MRSRTSCSDGRPNHGDGRSHAEKLVGVDMLNGAYLYLHLVPKGRDETGLAYTQAWVRHHDKYPD